jgi:hypothetical protein
MERKFMKISKNNFWYEKHIYLQKSILLISMCLFLVSFKSVEQDKRYGYVPNAEAAKKIAESVWLPIYGEDIYHNKPFKAKLSKNKIWIVEGTVHASHGGAPYIEIRKKDGKILKVTYGI